jgi:spore germination protein D
MRRIGFLLCFILLIVVISSCGTNSSTGQQDRNYHEAKTMVLDILKSDEGKKAISTANEDDGKKSKVKLLSIEDAVQLQQAVTHVLTHEENIFLKNLLKDPRFAGDFAKAIKDDTTQIQKQLLKDPDYQKLIIDVMKNPEYEKLLLDTMKSMPYRHLVMSIIEESLQSPLFRANLIDLLKTAIQEQTQSESEKKGNDKKQGEGEK